MTLGTLLTALPVLLLMATVKQSTQVTGKHNVTSFDLMMSIVESMQLNEI